ncbi:MAG TPA: flagellar basal body rod protein FlgB [Polyangiaceae bacterium]|nr:flagellar basal body rod protein FlgB [Polyangiaceae bacterium]
MLLVPGVSDMFASIGPLNSAMGYHLERHNVLSSNLAHVDTPGYRPKDLSRVEGFDSVLGVALRRTSERHMVGGDAAGPTVGRVFDDSTAGAGNDGNYVSIDREASKVAANHLRYDVISTIVQAELRQLRFAAGDGRG